MSTNEITFTPIKNASRKVLLLCIGLAFAAGAASVSAVTLGPQAKQEQAAERNPDNLPPLRLAIPLFDPNLPKSEKDQHKQGIWPELRNAEAVRFPVKIKEAIDAHARFDSVIVTPDTSASADLYLLGTILKSNGEDIWLSYRLIDATYREWIPRRTAKYRVPEGWHDRYDAEQIDPYGAMYKKIAKDVVDKLDEQGKRHLRDARRRKGRMTSLEQVTTTRDLVFATYFAPDVYGGSVKKSGKRGTLRINHLPAQDDETWYKIQAIGNRDERFSELISRQYLAFNAQMNSTYGSWMRDAHPVAMEIRKAKAARNMAAVLGAVAIAGAIAEGGEGNEVATVDTSVLLAIGGTLAIFHAFQKNDEKNALLGEINEIGRSVQGALKPMVVTLNDKTVTLTGTAQEQFDQWRDLLRESYADTAFDAEAVQFAEDGAASEDTASSE